MRLLALELENFGVFQGHHRLDLADSIHRNGHPDRILVIGHNGSGKSTLFRAIGLALYGSAAIGSRVGRDAYEHALADLIHRGPVSSTRSPASSARVAVEIEHIEFGEPVRLLIERTWSRGRTSVKERFSVTPLDDGGPESELDPEQALSALLPAELRRFVLVDVALIDELTATLQSWGTLEKQLRELSGLTTVERLRADLLVLAARDGDDDQYRKDAGKLGEFETRLSELDETVSRLRAELDEAEVAVASVERKIADQERELVRVGGRLAQNRPALRSGLAQAEADLEHATGELRELCAGLLPFVLCTELCVDLEKRLDQEAATSGAKSATAFADTWVRELRDDLLSDPRLRVLLPEQQGQMELVALIDDNAQRRLAELNSSCDTPPLHDLADRERVALDGWIGEIVSRLPQRAQGLRDELDQSERLRDSILSELDRVPDDAGLAEVQATLRALRTQLLEANGESSLLRDQLERTEQERLTAIAQMRRLEEQLADSLSAKSRAALLSQVGVALRDFEEELLRRRSEQFAEALVVGFNRLSRKQSLLSHATFDSETRTFKLEDPSGRELDTSGLSTGERQLFAMAILEGLRSTTGHSYPLVIDSPLAYLDENHRRSVMTQAVFESANQVVLFATDQEISLSASEGLTSDFTCVYQLAFDALEQSSELALVTSGDPCQQA